MCTVTYVPLSEGYCLTSNRDEKTLRKKASSPIQMGNIYFPRDEEKQGTWIVAKKNGDALCLLNGAFIKHIPSNNYRKSRGLIVLEIAQQDEMRKYANYIDLLNIEPFTLILIEDAILYELRWDGEMKHIKQLDSTHAYIWRSSTLYSQEVYAASKRIFTDWVKKFDAVEQNDIIQFHKSTNEFTKGDAFIMKRENFLQTVSITSIARFKTEIAIQYIDTIDNESNKIISFSNN